MALQTWASLNAKNDKNVIPPPAPSPTTVQRANNFVNNLSAHVGGGTANFLSGAIEPVNKLVASGARAIQATPDLLGGIINYAQGNKVAAQSGIDAANKTMATPVHNPITGGEQQTLAGSTALQNLGSGIQAASFLAPETKFLEGSPILTGVTTGGLQMGGSSLQDPNATAGGVLGNTGLGALTGGLLGAGGKYLPDMLKGSSKGASALHLPDQNIYTKVSPEQLDYLKNETKNIPFGQGDMPHLTPVEKLQSAGAKEVSLDEFKNASPNAKTALDNFDAQKGGVGQAQMQREQAATQGVGAMQNMQQQVGEFKSGLGQQFQQGAQAIEKSNPAIKLNLSQSQMDALNSLKESKSFALPDYVNQDKNAMVTVGGKPLDLSTMNPKMAEQIQKEMGSMQGKTAVSLSPTQAQDLITQLNKGTFTARATGQLAVNQQMIEVTNDIKNAANETFGPEWKNVYSNYAKGVTAVDKLNDIVNLDKTATPTDINKSLNSLLKLGQTPEGKVILRNAVDEFKAQSGIDLSDPVKAVHQILDKQIALEEAQSTEAEATKAAKAKAAKGSFVKQVTKGAMDPRYLGKRLIEGGAIAIFAYPIFRKLSKMIYGN